MPQRYNPRLVTLVLRTGGLGLLLWVWRMAPLLRESADAHSTTLEMLLAALIFLATSAGLALLILGRHLFDRVAVSPRWRRR